MITNSSFHLLILGAGSDQVKAIKIAQDIGITVTSIDSNKNAPGAKVSNFFFNVSNRDVKAINNVIKNSEIPIDGIFLIGSDIPEVLEQIRKENNIKGFSIKEPEVIKNKFLMKERFNKFSIPIPDYKLANDFKDIHSFICNSDRIIIKPTDSSGSRGVKLIEPKKMTDEELFEVFEDTKSFDSNGKVLIEEFIEGPQLSTESIIKDNKVHTFGFADRNYSDTKSLIPNIIENGGVQPSTFFHPMANEIDNLIKNIALSLGIKNGVIKGDLVFDGKKVKVIEAAFRLSGGDFSETLIPISTDFDFIGSAIKLALEIPCKIPTNYTTSRFVANRYFFGKEGIISEINFNKEILKEPWLHKLEFFKEIGDECSSAKSHVDRLGVFIISAKNIKTLEKRITKVYESVSIKIF